MEGDQRMETIIQQVINKLEKMNKGANVHTINKAIFYLKRDSFKTKNILAERCNKAYQSNDWSAVKWVLSGLF